MNEFRRGAIFFVAITSAKIYSISLKTAINHIALTHKLRNQIHAIQPYTSPSNNAKWQSFGTEISINIMFNQREDLLIRCLFFSF